MTDDERVKGLMSLADFRLARWKERRSYQWKMSLALWAALAFAVGYLAINKIAISKNEILLVALGLGAVVLGHAWFWVRTNWISAEMDIRTAFHFAEQAERILLPSSPVKMEDRLDPDEFERSHGRLKFLRRGVCQAQIFASVLLAVALVFVLVVRNWYQYE